MEHRSDGIRGLSTDTASGADPAQKLTVASTSTKREFGFGRSSEREARRIRGSGGGAPGKIFGGHALRTAGKHPI